MSAETKVVQSVEMPGGLVAAGELMLALAAGLKAGQPASALLLSLLPQAEAAVASVGELSADVADSEAYVFAGLYAAKLAQILVAKPAAPAAPAAAPAAP